MIMIMMMMDDDDGDDDDDDDRDDDVDDNLSSLSLVPYILQNKWTQINKQSLRKGSFTDEEDDYIVSYLTDLMRDTSFDINTTKFPRGTWAKLSIDLNRDLKGVYEHWTLSLKRRIIVEIDSDDVSNGLKVVS